MWSSTETRGRGSVDGLSMPSNVLVQPPAASGRSAETRGWALKLNSRGECLRTGRIVDHCRQVRKTDDRRHQDDAGLDEKPESSHNEAKFRPEIPADERTDSGPDRPSSGRHDIDRCCAAEQIWRRDRLTQRRRTDDP